MAVAVIHMEEEAMQISSSDDVIPTDSIAVYEDESIPMSINPSEVEVMTAVVSTTTSSSSSSTGSNLLGNGSDETNR